AEAAAAAGLCPGQHQGASRRMKEIMRKRIPLAILLALQALGGGAISLAHARDVGVPPPGVDASHTAGCAILHDEMRCALCQYASARVVTPPTFTIPER